MLSKLSKILLLIFVLLLMCSPVVFAQDNNDNDDNNDNNEENDNDNWIDENDLFPDDDNDNNDDQDDQDNDNNNEDEFDFDIDESESEYDILKIGGTLGISIPITVGETLEDAESPFDNTNMLGTPLTMMTYFSAALTDTLKAYAEFEYSYTPRYYDGLLRKDWVDDQFNFILDEMFLHINLNYILFVTLGKQNIKWGAGYMWSPTDYINTQRKDPLDPEADRNGITGVELSLPFSYSEGIFKFLTFIGFESMKNILDASITLRMEFSYKFFEISATAYYKKWKRPMFGVDFSSGLSSFLGGTLDYWVEGSFSMGSNRVFVDFDEDLPFGEMKFYTYEAEKDEAYFKVDLGFSYMNSDIPEALGSSIMFNVEYLYNQAGYSNDQVYLIPYAVILNYSEGVMAFAPFEMGQHYIGALFSLSEPCTIDDLSFTSTYILNASDYSQILYFSLGYSGIEKLSMRVYAKITIANEGTEFYFSSIITQASFFKNIRNNVDFVTQEILSYEGVLRELLVFGINFSVNF